MSFNWSSIVGPSTFIMTPRKRHYFENQFRRTPRVESRERVADWLQPVLRHPLIRCGVAFLEQVLVSGSVRGTPAMTRLSSEATRA
jgi:hypothetical protein